jgi:glycosyltransferase involved in cell wall biosynthesis
MSEGLPVVATDVGGTSEVVSDERTGFLVPPNQPEVLASKIKQLLENRTLRAQLGEAGLKVVRERFEVGRITDQYESIYQSILNTGPDEEAS